VRIVFKKLRVSVVVAAAILALPAMSFGQSAATMLPAESEAKGRELLQKAIAALGGQAYLNVKDLYRTGRLAQFASNGELSGFVKFEDYVKLPDKNRTEYANKKNLMSVNNGDKGWELDRGGVIEQPEESIKRYLEGFKKDVDMLLRTRLGEEGLRIRYAGMDILDLKPAEWVEVTDRERRITKIALNQATLLPVRAVYIHRDPETRQRTEETEYFSNYHTFSGIQTPKQISRERNGRKVYQVFFDVCQYNINPSDFLFTRESLDQRWAQLDKKKKK